MADQIIHLHTNFVSFFRDMATSHVDIKDFYRSYSEEDLGSKHEMQFPAMLLGGRESSGTSDSLDAGAKTNTVSFWIVDLAPEMNYDLEDVAIQTCEEICEEVMAKIIAFFDDEPLNGSIDLKSINGFSVRNTKMPGVAGWATIFSYTTESRTRIKEEKWQ